MEKIKLLLYCTKQPPYLRKTTECLTDVCEKYFTSNNSMLKENALNGKIVAECDFEVEEIETYYNNQIYKGCRVHTIKTYNISKLLELSCLNQKQLDDYLGESNGYAIHIKNLHIFDKPRELSECWRNTNAWIFSNEKLYVAPQNMRYCGDWNLKKAILISIHPEWLCKILNGEKAIEVRKKVLKEMINNA